MNAVRGASTLPAVRAVLASSVASTSDLAIPISARQRVIQSCSCRSSVNPLIVHKPRLVNSLSPQMCSSALRAPILQCMSMGPHAPCRSSRSATIAARANLFERKNFAELRRESRNRSIHSGDGMTSAAIEVAIEPELGSAATASDSAALAGTDQSALEGTSEGTGTEKVASVETAKVSAEEENAIVDGLDIRIGKILKAYKHPEADSLYVEEVDLGEEAGPRTICSGLVKYVQEAELQDRMVVVLANLKPRNMRGVKSNGMLLAASDAAHENVELLAPPPEAQMGERVWFGGEDDKAQQGNAGTPNQVHKKKIWEAVQPRLKTTEEGGVVVYLGSRPMRVDGGVVTAPSLKGANVS